jgi:hypothetical protein
MNQDEKLQFFLEQIENGQPLDQTLNQIPHDEMELRELVILAVNTHDRARELPPLNPLKSQAHLRRVASAASDYKTQPLPRPAVPGRVTGPAQTGLPKWLWGMLPLALGLTALFAIVSLAGAAFLLSSASAARAATLMDVSGVVEVSQANQTGDWTPMSDGAQLRQGMRLRTRADSSATLVFYDGSRTVVAPYSDIALENLGGGWNILFGRGLQVRYQQYAGETTHSVVPLKGGSSFFEVLTPAGKASVHGTIFDVLVNQNGFSRFAVQRGVVAVSHANASVTLTAGQATLSNPQGDPSQPTYEFTVQGAIQAIIGDQWTVNGLTFTVPSTLVSEVTFTVGDWVVVRGRILADGVFQADRIDPANNETARLRFTGIVEVKSTDQWTISGRTVLIDERTEIGDEINVGDPVEVNFVTQPDGSWLAKEIERLDKEDEDEKGTPTATATITATPAETATVTPTGEDTETPEPYPYPSPEVTQTPTPVFTPTPEGNRAGCQTGDNQHPEGLRLADRWGVPYTEIMGWFCQGFGFGEIDLAYELAASSGTPVADIFAMKAGGMGWGQIKQQLTPKHPVGTQPSDQKPGRPTNPGKGPKK